MILGIDEVGRGPWAGPLVVGAVVLPESHTIDGLTDSKKLSDKRRRELDVHIRKQALAWGLGWVHADELDDIGLSAALKLATIRAVEAVNASYHEIIIDGTINFLKETTKGKYVTLLPKADLLIPAVSAASIIAKVARDSYMQQQDEVYPQYGFGAHVGYGTAKHQAALLEHGVTPLHRTSFAPIAKLFTTSGRVKTPITQTTTAIGTTGEDMAADFLAKQGYEIIERNWKTKWCEIDIIAEDEVSRYFVEVKYRSSAKQGGGVAAITPAKLKKMNFAAELFQSSHSTAKQPQLMVCVIEGKKAPELLKLS